MSKYLKKNSATETDLHCKDTDRHQYLHAKSCHRYVYKKYIPFDQAIRLRRIIFDDIVLDERLKELETCFKNRDYNSEKVKPKIERVKTTNRTDLLRKREKEIDNRITSSFLLPSGSNKIVENFTKGTQTYAQISTFNCSLTFTTSTCFPYY